MSIVGPNRRRMSEALDHHAGPPEPAERTEPVVSPSVLAVRPPLRRHEEPVDAATALGMVVDEVDFGRELCVPVGSATPGGGRAVVFRLPHRRVLHVVGDGLLAQRLRELITLRLVDRRP